MKKKIFRIIDANFNRSREALRVCEEITRLALDSRPLTRELKGMRNAVSRIVQDFAYEFEGSTHARDAKRDVGRASRIPGGMDRRSVRDVFTANMERAKESLRVLEEFFKLIDPATSMKFSRLRFRAYDAEKKTLQKLEPHRHRRQGSA